MKHLKLLTFLFVVALTFISCEKEDPPDCGCDSKITTTIPESAELTGTISFKKQLDPDDDFYINEYWITISHPDCSICFQHLIICNENKITNEIKGMLNSEKSVNVEFSGYLKQVCKKRFDISNISYSRILLTKIRLQ